MRMVPRRRGYGKCEQHCGLAGAGAAAHGGWSRRVSAVEVESRPLSVSTLSFPSSSLYSHPPPSPPRQLYQQDKSLRNTLVTSPLLQSPYRRLSETFIFPTGCRGAPHIVKTHTRASLNSPGLRDIYPQISQPQNESAVLRHCWFGKPASGRC